MVLLKDVVHLCHVLAGDDLDDVPLVVGRVEASATATLSIAGDGSAPSQRVLPRVRGERRGVTGREGSRKGERWKERWRLFEILFHACHHELKPSGIASTQSISHHMNRFM